MAKELKKDVSPISLNDTLSAEDEKEKVGVGWVEKREEREGGMKEGISPICHVVSSIHFGNCKPW